MSSCSCLLCPISYFTCLSVGGRHNAEIEFKHFIKTDLSNSVSHFNGVLIKENPPNVSVTPKTKYRPVDSKNTTQIMLYSSCWKTGATENIVSRDVWYFWRHIFSVLTPLFLLTDYHVMSHTRKEASRFLFQMREEETKHSRW